MSELRNIYIGLPPDLVNNVLCIAEEYRTNSMSFEVCGSDVIVEYHTQEVLGYDRIKMP